MTASVSYAATFIGKIGSLFQPLEELTVNKGAILFRS